MSEDTGVYFRGASLDGKRIVLAVSGGIAATESVKLARELRRHGATVFPMMTKSAEKVITPLALSWGSGSEVITEWKSEMSQLGAFDGLILAPATRNTIAKFTHGILDSPVMMAMSAASGRGVPILFVPSMHNDLFDDAVTADLLSSLEEIAVDVIVDNPKEGKRKQPGAVSIVAEFCNLLNRKRADRKRVAVTLGGNLAPIDSVRNIVNTSSGKTGWAIAEHLHRMGHDVICIAGHTTKEPLFSLPDVRQESSPEGMLKESINLAISGNKPDYWIHAAAVLDYAPEPTPGKVPSGSGKWDISLLPTQKHLHVLRDYVNGSKRIGFKLEVDGDEEGLIEKSKFLISDNALEAVVANMLIDAQGRSKSRCRIVYPTGEVQEIGELRDLCEALESIIATN